MGADRGGSHDSLKRRASSSLPTAIISITVGFAMFLGVGAAMAFASGAILLLGYGGRVVWSLVRHHGFYVPLLREGDAPRAASGQRGDGFGSTGTRVATIASSVPTGREYRRLVARSGQSASSLSSSASAGANQRRKPWASRSSRRRSS